VFGVPAHTSTAPSAVIDAAQERFFNFGFRAVTMDDLAIDLGMSKKTLYAHFSSKRDLLEAVLRRRITAIAAEFDRLANAPDLDLLAKLYGLIDTLVTGVSAIRPPLIRDVQRDVPELFAEIDAMRGKILPKHFGKIFEEGRRTGLIRTDLDSNIVIQMLIIAVQAIVSPENIERLDITPAEAYRTVLTVMIEGILTEKGRELA
jgi:AcrR family transcriptional regulator